MTEGGWGWGGREARERERERRKEGEREEGRQRNVFTKIQECDEEDPVTPFRSDSASYFHREFLNS